ncbi:pentapeptide repeat-containing protein [Micrococcaceae bacterium Sec6.3]
MSAVPDSLPLEGARFVHRSLRSVRFVDSDLSGVTMRGVMLDGADLDSPWLLDG